MNDLELPDLLMMAAGAMRAGASATRRGVRYAPLNADSQDTMAALLQAASKRIRDLERSAHTSTEK